MIGLYLAVLGPLSVAIMRNHDPIHRGHYFEWAGILIMTLVPTGAIVLGLLSWLEKCPSLLRTLRSIGLVLASLLSIVVMLSILL